MVGQSAFKLQSLLAASLVMFATTSHALVITPNFGTSITSSANATQIEAAINQALGTLDSLYSNAVNLSVDFTYTAASSGNLLSTTQYYYSVSYSDYVAKLHSDATAHPENTVLATAIAHLPQGNDANGSGNMALSSSLYEMLGFGIPATPAPVININNLQNFSFTQPTGASQFDLIGGLEHELDEVLGGGGGGSTLNAIYAGNSWFAGKYGPMDLYRYSAPGTPSFTTSSGATSYFSIDGGVTDIVGFNQSASGDFADLTPQCGGVGGYQYIQNAFNCVGPYETYTTASPEYTMLESIGWNPFVSSNNSLPEPDSGYLFLIGLAAMAGVMKARNREARGRAAQV